MRKMNNATLSSVVICYCENVLISIQNVHFQIRNKEMPICADASSDPSSREKSVRGYPCHNMGGNQVLHN